jgi:hypothetical protein
MKARPNACNTPSRPPSSERIEHHQNSTLCQKTRHAGVPASDDVMLNISLLTPDGTALRPNSCACLARWQGQACPSLVGPSGLWAVSVREVEGRSADAAIFFLRPFRSCTGDLEALRRPQDCERAIGRALLSRVKQVRLRAIAWHRDATESEECEEGYQRTFHSPAGS